MITLKNPGDIDELIAILIELRKVHGNLPVYHHDDCLHEPIQWAEIVIPDHDDELYENAGLPKRILLS